MKQGKTVCTAHILNQRVISDVVILDIRLKAMWAQNNPEGLQDPQTEKLCQHRAAPFSASYADRYGKAADRA